MKLNGWKIPVGVASLCILGIRSAYAGDLTVDNLTVTTNATIQGRQFIGTTTSGYANEQWWLGASGFTAGRIMSLTNGADFALDASRNGGNAPARLLFGQNSQWKGALGFDSSNYFRLMVGANPTLGQSSYTALTIDTSKKVTMAGNLAVNGGIDLNGGVSAGGLSIAKEVLDYYHFDYGNSHVAIGNGTYGTPAFSALDYGNGGTFQVGGALGFGQYNGGTMRIDGEGIGLWDAYGGSLILNYGTTWANSLQVGNDNPWWAFVYKFLLSDDDVEVAARINNNSGDVYMDLTASQWGGNGSASVRFGVNGEWNGLMGVDGDDGYKLKFDVYPASHLGEQTAMTIDTDKRVGIGTSTPTERLHVSNGNIKVEGGQFIGNGSGLLISAQGDLSMGTFTAGPQP